MQEASLLHLPGVAMDDQIQALVRGIYAGSAISVVFEAMDVGVLSNVVHVTVTLPTRVEHLIAKFPRPEFPMMHAMFAVEAAFYTRTNKASVPFELPPLLSASADAIVLRKLDNVISYSCYDGCPSEHVLPILTQLATLHAAYWDQSFPELAAIPGIGANLSVQEKQTHFCTLYAPFYADLGLPATTLAALDHLCNTLAQGTRLTRLHEAVEAWHKTLIHGDLHVANMLFHDDRIVLLDWATCGRSNPLRDVAFFFTVSVTSTVREATEAPSLRAYATTLAHAIPSVSIEAIETMYYLCVLNQFVILVGYNTLTMSLAGLGSTPAKQVKLREGFLETNKRSCAAALHAYTMLAKHALFH
ncbi:hypothetical protein SPRG_01727 [Saprolegnia parasitica CBS 223.65]|uniref:CHK kinase-like domain-containing protein n=1 Tax=Saprolegnia parasitica (strain CBS 223.65) TaxID=695850 RepID=A0A067CTL8_SAPPC|nr:hypothetical protein SPRG_01727 [Saprolegnia parasitica CBS 223.65]KDO33848.1 hypothetical protein SPRG_01727 [Saprolegnia parasitica CBS 223.65]|eukprot:XP_012195484.1 hypothetical protein SPRG_01727 [Saprolegnia parasitica CBS 223.65]